MIRSYHNNKSIAPYGRVLFGIKKKSIHIWFVWSLFKNKIFSHLILCYIIFIRPLFIYPMINHSCQVNRSPMRGLLYNNIFFRICFIWDRFDSQKENRISIDAGLIQFAFGSQKSIRTWFWNNSIHKTKIDFRIRCRVGSIHKKKNWFAFE